MFVLDIEKEDKCLIVTSKLKFEHNSTPADTAYKIRLNNQSVVSLLKVSSFLKFYLWLQ